MTEHLTDHNGVVCRHCFTTVDLTTLKLRKLPKWVEIFNKISGPSPIFTVQCPHCKKRASYSYDKDVKPIAFSEDKEKYEQSIKKVKEGAKIIVNELLSQNKIKDTELDNDLDQIDPKTPPKSKDKSSAFYS